MKRFITDIFNKNIEVTNLPKAIEQAEMYSKWSDKNVSKEANQHYQAYWVDMLAKLKKLKAKLEAEPVPVKVEDPIADKIPVWVKEMRQKYHQRLDDIGYKEVNISYKLFSKDKKDSPLYGAHSCVRTLRNLHELDKLEVGETWDRGYGSPSLTRIF